ncbi:MAG TPA: DPP IV N-terminal domain-containing protein [Ferruginibacter sp.]|nr:DPP IV N-terminal domain-containing protein [Ferruginibacter sp.]HNA00611.1 DPP IV N-terminal domain-containing protein [Ferruginibacter sp.]HNJ28931.1 DPP IV N-terminal domain-containing protein [Ferruginibacter sp.]HNO99220.1 DPP IV N-terminal domain-containing protein [Ferruginibacter sp.]
MKKIFLSQALIALLALAAHAQSDKKVLTVADYDQATKAMGFNTSKLVFRANVNPNWLPDGRFWYSVSIPGGVEFVLVNPADGSRKTGPDKKSILPEEQASSNSPATGRRRGGANESVSPDGKKAAFIRDWNLWVRDLETKKETQLTFDGVKDYGYATDNAGWTHSDRPIMLWSPDSKKIATFQQDQRHIHDMYLVKTKVGAPELEQWKYPLPEDKKIIQIERVIIEVDVPKVIRLKIPSDDRRGTLSDDIASGSPFDDNEWNADATKLMFVSTSRDHKIEKVRIANALTGEVREVFEEKVATQYESGQGSINNHFLDKTNEIIWYSERDDWGHLYLYDANTGKLKNQVTKGNFVVTQLLKIDEKNRVLYFMANGREPGRDPYYGHFYRINFDGSNLQLLTPEDGNHNISLSADGKYFVDNFSQPHVPPVSVLRDMKGKLITELERADISKLLATGWKPVEPIKVRSHDNKWDLYGLMFKPRDFDPSKKYPIVNYVYPGPQGGGVGSRNFAPARGDHQALADLGFIVVIIDGSCNPDRSKSFHDVCYGNMGSNTLDDQIAGIKQLAAARSYMDLDKVGIWGHSGGGFATADAMFTYPDFYKVGISESGNHDNRNYEDDWGERYIGLEEKGPDGTTNYAKQANQINAGNLKGKLMLAHGGMDDNVPPYNTYLVVDALQKANKDFDLVVFPNARHGYGQDGLYMTRRRWDYFGKNLMGAEVPKEYKINPGGTSTQQAQAKKDNENTPTGRKNNVFSRLEVSVSNITMELYDNGTVDGDSISIFYNNKLLVSNRGLSEKAITVNFMLDEKAPQHEIILFANNLGSIPPNTATVVVKAGEKRYELRSSASLTENAVLVLEYKPK